MSWTRVVIRDEIGDFANNLSEIIGVQTEVLLGPSMAPPEIPEPHLPCLHRIDPYGDTLFDQSEFDLVLQDLATLWEFRPDQEEKKVIAQIEELVKQYQNAPQRCYLAFLGD